MTETRQEVVTAANTRNRPLMRRMSPDEILKASDKISHKSITALRSAWPELGRYRSESEGKERAIYEAAYSEPRSSTLKAG